MGVNSLPKTVTRERRSCDLNPGPSAPEFSTLTTRLCCPGGSVAEWLAYWTEAQKDPGSNRSRDAVG